MQAAHLLLEEPIRMASILEPSKPNFFPALTKIVGTLGPESRSVEMIESCLKAGMSVARFDFSWGDSGYHQETLENLRKAVKNTKKLCAVSSLFFYPVFLASPFYSPIKGGFVAAELNTDIYANFHPVLTMMNPGLEAWGAQHMHSFANCM
eukprot:Gb_29462 [translate_table: standard]